jgi:hypothetical protein
VPRDARYTAHFKETWVWVQPDGMEGLSRLTLAILFVAKAKPGEAETAGAGLMYTGGGR